MTDQPGLVGRPPGSFPLLAHVRSWMDFHRWPHETLATRCGILQEHAERLMHPATLLTPEDAEALAQGLGGHADCWLRLSREWIESQS